MQLAPADTTLTLVPSSPEASSPTTRKVMQGNRSVSALEVALRSELHRRGMRFRKNAITVPGVRCRPDIVFSRAPVAVECRGCFWHLCPEDAVLPKSNLDYWLPKLTRNVERDRCNEHALIRAGWTLVIVWEHEDISQAADRVERVVRSEPA
jgi:DNA mismatch endonuclease, patch repair protein